MIHKIRRNAKLIAVSGVFSSSMFRVYECMFCSVNLVFAYEKAYVKKDVSFWTRNSGWRMCIPDLA